MMVIWSHGVMASNGAIGANGSHRRSSGATHRPSIVYHFYMQALNIIYRVIKVRIFCKVIETLFALNMHKPTKKNKFCQKIVLLILDS